MGGSHHADVRHRRQIAFADLATTIRTIKDRQMLITQMRCTFDRHRADHEIVGFVDLRLGEAKMFKQLERRIVHLLVGQFKDFAAEFLAIVYGLMTNRISNAPGNADSILARISSLKPRSCKVS